MDRAPNNSPYTPLKSKESIRLIEISPDDGDEGKISCKLFDSALDAAPKYLALSYVWGDPEKTTTITCNDATMRATENLEAAMRKLRTRYGGNAFWIDAICINQSDLAERAQQVRLMREIYKSAENVIVYLGEESEGLPRAMGLFRVLDEMARDVARVRGSGGDDLDFSPLRDQLPKPHEEVWYRLHDFFNRPWFSRIWVLQEVFMASSDPDVICGSHALSWSQVARVAEFMHESGIVGATRQISRSINAARIRYFKEDPLPLLKMMHQTQTYESKEPHDRLFALYGIVVEGERKLLENSEYFTIDYAKAVEDVYRDAVLGHIMHYETLEMICAVNRSEKGEVERLPSWVPDWTTPPRHIHTSVLRAVDSAGYDACGGMKAFMTILADPNVLRVAGKSHDVVDWAAVPFDASHDLQPLRYRRRPRVLEKLWNEVMARLGKEEDVCEAFWRTLIQNIDGAGRPVSKEKHYPIFLRFWHESKLQDKEADEYMSENSTDVTTKSLGEDEDRVLYQEAEEGFNQGLSIEEHEALKSWTQSLAQQHLPCTHSPECKHCLIIDIPEKNIRDGISRIVGHSPALALRDSDPFIADFFDNLNSNFAILRADHNAQYLNRVRTALHNRAFFITKGGLMGVGPKQTRPGDEVAVLSGSRIPFVLRRTETSITELDLNIMRQRLIWQYEVLGDCYVHGIMKGEAVAGLTWNGDYDVFDLA